MNLNIKTTNISLTPAIRDYFEKKLMSLDKLVDFNRDNVLVQAELGKTTHHHRQGDIFRAEVNLRVSGNNYRAVSEKDDLYAAIDAMKDELNQMVKAGKEKRTSIVRKGAQRLKNILRFGNGNDNVSL
jgi:putative sigma-54 modulation protein